MSAQGITTASPIASQGQPAAQAQKGAWLGRVILVVAATLFGGPIGLLAATTGLAVHDHFASRRAAESPTPPPLVASRVSREPYQAIQETVGTIREKVQTILAQHTGSQAAGGGVHGAQFLTEAESVESPVSENPVAKKSVKLGVLKREEERSVFDGFRQKGLFLSRGVQDPLMVGEEAACVLSKSLGFGDMVPDTAVVTHEGRKASLQAFVGGYELASKAVRERFNAANPDPPLTKEERNLFQKMVCLDFILGNADRHSQNWMVKWSEPDAAGKRTVIDIKLIDNGPSLPRQHAIQGSGDFWRTLAAHNQYNWATFQAADGEFTDEMKAFIRDLNPQTLDDTFAAIEAAHPGYLTPEIELYACQRLDLLKRAAEGRVSVRDSQDGEARSFRVRDLFVFMDKRICDSTPSARDHSTVAWTPQLHEVFQKNAQRNIDRKRQ